MGRAKILAGGGGEIRTRGPRSGRRFSRPVVSTAHPPLRLRNQKPTELLCAPCLRIQSRCYYCRLTYRKGVANERTSPNAAGIEDRDDRRRETHIINYSIAKSVPDWASGLLPALSTEIKRS